MYIEHIIHTRFMHVLWHDNDNTEIKCLLLAITFACSITYSERVSWSPHDVVIRENATPKHRSPMSRQNP